MTLEYFLLNTSEFKVPALPQGKASSVTELYESLIKHTLPKKETIERWHELLLKYIQQEDAIFFIRRYASASNKQWNLIRRGFLTEYASGFKYVFCDNFFAHYFYLMAMHNFTPTLEEFIGCVKLRKFPYGFMKTKEEEPFQAFPKGKTVNINTAGWKLAHLYSVNQNDYSFDYKNISKFLFPRGNQLDWKTYPGNDYPSRYINEAYTNELRKISIAHFLRLVHPINYFLVPKTSLSNLDIGEFPELISFMKKKAYSQFQNILIEYENLIMSKETEEKAAKSFIFSLEYGFSVTKSATGKDLESLQKSDFEKVAFDDNIYHKKDLLVIKAYLIDALSFRNIEREILNIDSQARGGGFIAKSIINSYGIGVKDKGTVTWNNIDGLISNKTGKLQMTLIKLKEYLMDGH